MSLKILDGLQRLRPVRLCRSKFSLILGLTILFTGLMALPARSQWPIVFNQPEPTETAFGWRPNAERSCGKMVCSDVYLYGSRGISFIVAGPSEKLQEVSDAPLITVEERARLVQSIFRELLRVVKEQDFVNRTIDRAESHWSDLFRPREELFPITPRIEVGIENDQTVVFIPEQLNYGLKQQSIVTITEFDAVHNGQTKENLALAWRDVIRQSISHQLWETAFDRQFPWARPLVAIAIILISGLVITGIEGLRSWLRRFNRELRAQLKASEKELKKAMTIDPEAMNTLDSPPADLPTRIATDLIINPQSNLRLDNMSRANPFNPFGAVTGARESVNQFFQTVSRGFLKEQTLLKQKRNLLQLIIQLVLWSEFVVLFLGAGAIATLLPIARPYAPYVFSQAVLLPIIWMGVTLADTFVDIQIDYHLNQWAKDAQLNHPNSNRYTLRVSTYSPALQSATTLIFGFIGFYLTIQAFGIDPAVLASAGALAVIVAFVSRNVLQDMLNGALILWTDRFAIGDVIKVGEFAGLVEDMNLYMTEIRGSEGRLITVPNGQISTVENLTKDWSRVDFTIEIAYNADIQLALKLITQVADEMRSDPQWTTKILEPASVLGVDRVTHTGLLIQVWIKTQAMQQWSVGREFRLRVKQAFDEAGIEIGYPQQAIVYSTPTKGHPLPDQLDALE